MYGGKVGRFVAPRFNTKRFKVFGTNEAFQKQSIIKQTSIFKYLVQVHFQFKMTSEKNIISGLDPQDFAEALKTIQEGERTADEIENKLDLMEQRMAILLEQVEKMQEGNELLRESVTTKEEE
ncbi:YIL002W-A [Zygosaccharomyces parabailii]|nr:YIL002W-A [Zygosaccharomyces parabailii]